MPSDKKKKALAENKREQKEIIRSLLDTRNRRNKLDALVDSLMDKFGGPHKIAELMFSAYEQARPGSMIQARLVDTILRLLERHDARYGGNDQESLDAATDVQLKALIQEVTGVHFEDSAERVPEAAAEPDGTAAAEQGLSAVPSGDDSP